MIEHRMNPRVFWGSSAVILTLLAAASFAPQTADLVFRASQSWAIDIFGWLYIAAVVVFLFVVLALGFGPAGRLRLGPDESEPDFPICLVAGHAVRCRHGYRPHVFRRCGADPALQRPA